MKSAKPRQANLYEAKTQLSRLVEEPKPVREPGRLKRQIWMADDFDTLPADILAAFNGEDDDPMAPLRALLEERKRNNE